jgi:hypothetical protein
MGTQWMRLELPWLRIEPTPGNFRWAPYDAAMMHSHELGIKALAVLHSPPAWASLESCGLITNTVAMTTFLTQATERYGPLVDAWEFINEPDGKHYLPNYGPTIGCWAPYPNQYAQQLKLFYMTVKAHDPTALVLFGSLAYDNWTIFDRQFLDHVLQNPEGAYFDVFGLHYYPINFQEFPSIRDKIREVRTKLARYGLAHKRIWITETSMWSNAGATLEHQKDYIAVEQTRGLCSGADNLFWFAIREEPQPPALNRWLINRRHQPDQGYFTYQHVAARLRQTTCQGAVATLPAGIEAYRFTGGPQSALYVLWSTTTTQTVTLPAMHRAVIIDRDGVISQTLGAQNGSVHLSAGLRPLFAVIDPRE